jgi:hypothetical protein
MKIVAVMTCHEKDLPNVDRCVRSLMESISPPEEIIITLVKNTDVPDTLKNTNSVCVQYADTDYGSLTAVLGFMDKYPNHSDVYAVLLNSSCIYPVHLISEYKHSLLDLQKAIKDKLPASNGSVFGITGVVMAEDKKLNMEREFKSLVDDNLNTGYEKRTLLGYVRENATVDYLETSGSILIHRNQLQNDFLTYLSKVWPKTSATELSTDIILCNYLALKNTVRTQICNIIINRYMMERMGCFKNNVAMPDQEKRDMYENTVKHLRTLKCFNVYK